MEELLEGKKIDSDYEKDYSEIEREIFDQIISLDPQTNIEQDRIGPSSKQLLLPCYLNGETDFLNDAENLKLALQKYTANRKDYPQVLRNIANFPSVKDFIDFVLHGADSEFAKTHDLDNLETEQKPKESNIDKIYNKYYSKLDRQLFNTIIALDPDTTENQIGSAAKNLLLPRALSGEDFSDIYDQITDSILKFNLEKSSYPEDKRSIEKFPSVEEFVTYVIQGPETDFIKKLKENEKRDSSTGNMVKDDINFLGSTRQYDIVQPLSWAANNAITCNSERRRRGDEYFTWCTGWTDDTSQWNGHSRNEWIYCFIDKSKPTPTRESDRQSSYQLAIRKSDNKVYQFLDGNDKAYGIFNNTDSKQNEKFFRDFLKANPDVAVVLLHHPHIGQNNVVQEIAVYAKYEKTPFVYTGQESYREFREHEIYNFVKEIIIKDVDKIAPGAFAGSSALEKVTFNSGLKEIGPEAFMKCIKLNNIELPESLEKIGAEAFAECLSLKNTIRIPNNLTDIGREAFRGTHCKLSIDRKREKKLNVNVNDRQWFISHAKAITVQEGLEENMITEEILDEKIPSDLARAYKNSRPAEYGIQSHPRSNHTKIGGDYRRAVDYDYEKATYEEISKQEAIDYLGLSVNVLPDRNEDGKIVAKVRTTDREGFNQKISNLRFIIDNKVIEYEVRSGNTLYLAYWMDIPQSYFTDYPLFKGKYGETRDCRYGNKYSDIYTIIQISDKIYKTDEYEHEITDETPTGKKIKVLRKDSNGNPVLDDEGNLIYDLVDDTIVAKRARNKSFSYLRTLKGKDEPEYAIHKPSQNLKTKIIPNELDTGAHDIRRIASGSWELQNQLSDYINAVTDSKKAFKEFDYIRRYVKKIESEREYFEDEAEYNELLQKLNARKDELYNVYLQCKKVEKSQKQKLILNISKISEEVNKNFVSNIEKLEKILTGVYNISQKQAELTLSIVTNDSPEVNELQARIKKQEEAINAEKENIRQLEEKKNDLLRSLDLIKQKIEEGSMSIEEASTKLNQIVSQMDQVSKEALENKFKRIDELKAEQESLQAELEELAPTSTAQRKSRAAKNKEKELDSDLSDIVVFVDTPSEVVAQSQASEETIPF